MEIRKAQVSDAQSVLNLMYQLDNETSFMLFEPNERQTTLAQQQSILASFEDSLSQVMLVAVVEEKVVGFIVGAGNSTKRNKHALYCVMGIVQSATGKGLGRQLLGALQIWAQQHQITRMELTVMSHNDRAISLYKNCGFTIEGTKKQSLLVDGKYVDEHYMAKLLSV